MSAVQDLTEAIPGQKYYTNMGLNLNGYRDMSIWNV